MAQGKPLAEPFQSSSTSTAPTASTPDPSGPPVHAASARPASFKLPQIITEGVLRKGMQGSIITFQLRVLRIVELQFVVAVPKEGTTRAPVYVRFWLDRSQEDKPGTVTIVG